MDNQITHDDQARLEAWLANRAPTEVPASLTDRIARIPRSVESPPRRRSQRLAVSGRRSRPALLLAAALATTLAAVAGGSFFAASRPDNGVTVSAAPSTLAAAPSAPRTREPATPTADFIATWATDFRSDGVLPAVVANGVDHGTISTPIGRARWVHLTGNSETLPDPLVPIPAPDGSLVWFTSGGPGAACYNDPKSAMCTDPRPPALFVSNGALAPREPRRLPIDVAEANLALSGGTFWFTSTEPLTVWRSADLETWEQTDLSGLQAPGPASIDWRTTVSPSDSVDGAAVALVEYAAADPGSLLGYPGRPVSLRKGPAGYVARENHPMREGGDKDLAAITVRKTSDGISFVGADGREVGHVPGVGVEFVDKWTQSGLVDHQLAVLDGERWSHAVLPVAPLSGWPTLVKVGDTLLVFVVEPDRGVRAWRTIDGHTWRGGEVLLGEDGTPMRSTGVTYHDGENGPVLVILGADDASGWTSTDGERWTSASFVPGEIPPARLAQGWFRTADQTADGDWQVSSDGQTWESVPALSEVVSKTSPSGAGGTSESVVGNTVFFSVDEDAAPFNRDVWMIQFERPAP